VSGPEPEAPPVGEEVHLPGPTLIPFLSAIAITLIVIGTTINWIFSAVGGVLFIPTIALWIRDTRRDLALPASVAPAGLSRAWLAGLGAVLVVVSRFLDTAGGRSAWDGFTKRYSVIEMILALGAVALVLAGLARQNRATLRAASYVGAYVLGSTFPLILRTFGHFQIGFWVGVVGGVLLVLGAAIAAGAVPDTSGSDARPTPGASGIAVIALLVLIGSLAALHIARGASAWSAAGVPTHYPLVLTLLAAGAIALTALAVGTRSLTAVGLAAVVSCFLFAEAFPLVLRNYNGLKVGFWLGAIASLVGAFVLFAAAVSPGSTTSK
jgi:hypothetical protein